MVTFTFKKASRSLVFVYVSLYIINQIHAESVPTATRSLRQNLESNQPPFNFYVLSMSFQPEFCYSHYSHKKHDQYPGCAHPLETWKHNLTIHGLWPQYVDGTWPSTCSNEKFDPAIMEEFGWDLLDERWPNVKASESNIEEYVTFWEHEWTKHGTCSGLSQHDYFNAALNHFVHTPPVVYDYYLLNSNKEQKSVKDSSMKSFPKQLLLIGYGGPGQVVPVCLHGKYLSEIRMCFGKDEVTNLPMDRIACPDVFLEEDSCGEEIIVSVFHEDAPDISKNENDQSHVDTTLFAARIE